MLTVGIVVGRFLIITDNRRIVVIPSAIDLVDVHCRIAHHRGTVTIATTKDLTDAGEGLHVDLWVFVDLRARLLRCAVGIIAIYRVASLVATAIEFTNLDRSAAYLLDIHCDGTIDGATEVVTAKHTVEGTVGDVQRHIALDGSSLGTAIDSVQSRYTSHQQLGFGIHRCTLTTAVGLVYAEFTSAVLVQQGDSRLAHITLGVRTTEDTVNSTTKDIEGRLAGAIGDGTVSCGTLLFRVISRVVLGNPIVFQG